jgi:quercetin dioxygenase-like cupin family protein
MLAGDMIYLDADVPHSLKAKANSIVRLTLSKFDKIERIEELINGT